MWLINRRLNENTNFNFWFCKNISGSLKESWHIENESTVWSSLRYYRGSFCTCLPLRIHHQRAAAVHAPQCTTPHTHFQCSLMKYDLWKEIHSFVRVKLLKWADGWKCQVSAARQVGPAYTNTHLHTHPWSCECIDSLQWMHIVLTQALAPPTYRHAHSPHKRLQWLRSPQASI